MSTTSFAYMSVKSSKQGDFVADSSRGGPGRFLCRAVRFKGSVPRDVRTGEPYAATQHDPITVVCDWGHSTVQFLTALWNNEVLDQVLFEFVETDDAGKEVIYATLTLAKATIAHVELRAGNTTPLLPGDHRSLDEIGLFAQRIEFSIKAKSGAATAIYDRTAIDK